VLAFAVAYGRYLFVQINLRFYFLLLALFAFGTWQFVEVQHILQVATGYLFGPLSVLTASGIT
jgi:hypothetical protein